MLVRTESRLSISCGTLSWSRRASVSRMFSPDVSQKLFTLVGLPCCIVNQPSRARRWSTSRSVVRVTPISSESSRSAGRIDPAGKRLFQMLSMMYSSAKPAGLCALMTIVRFPLHSFSKLHSSYQRRAEADSAAETEKRDRRFIFMKFTNGLIPRSAAIFAYTDVLSYLTGKGRLSWKFHLGARCGATF